MQTIPYGRSDKNTRWVILANSYIGQLRNTQRKKMYRGWLLDVNNTTLTGRHEIASNLIVLDWRLAFPQNYDKASPY